MKTLLLAALFVSSTLFAQGTSSRSEDINLIKQAVAAEYKEANFSSLEKWIVYGLEEENSTAHAVHKPAMVFLLNGNTVVTHYYMAYDKDLNVYAYSFCNCCHLEKEDNGLIAHCEETCTKPPFTTRSQLEPFKPLMKDLIVYK